MMNFAPIAALGPIELRQANELLVQWGHKMGPVNRPSALATLALLVYGVKR